MSTDTAKSVACAIVGSRLDYCNSLLHNISKKNIQKLQRIQNNLARVVLKAPRLRSPEPMLASLHWLPVVYRITYKLAIITFKALTTGQPTYLADLLHRRVALRHTRSSTPDSLVVPSIRTKMASRAFSHAAPTIWNNLPHDVRETISINSFRTRLKHFTSSQPMDDKSDVSVPLGLSTYWHLNIRLSIYLYAHNLCPRLLHNFESKGTRRK